MSMLNGTLRLARLALPVALALSAGASWAGVSVTEVAVSQTGNNTVLSYRLNEPATTVTITAGGANYNGGTAKGLNSVNLPLNIVGGATITATAPAESGGAAGGVILVPLTNPLSATDAANGQIVGIAVNKRPNSPYRGRIYVPFGPSQTVKQLSVYSTDGVPLQTKNLLDIATSGSWPYGIGLAQNDLQDRIVVANRSATLWKVINPDMSQGAQYTQTFCVPGMQITPNTDPATKDTAPWNIYGSDGAKTGGTRHAVANLTDQTGFALINATEAMPAGVANAMDPHGLAIDPTNQVMYKTIVSDGGTGPITTTDQGVSVLTTTNMSKWTSPANSAVTWTRDDAWGNTLLADIKASLGDGTVDPSGLVAGGIALDKGFDANNLAASKVWITISGTYTPAGGTAGNINRIYHVKADTGNIIAADTIDLQAIGAVSPATTGPFNNKGGHYIDITGAGNIAITFNSTISLGVISATAPRYFAVIAPNTTGPTSDTVTVASLVPPLAATGSSSNASVGNTGTATVTYTIACTDSAGIVADNVQVTADLTQIGGTTGVALTRGTVSADGKSASYTTSFLVPTTAPLGAFDIPFALTSTSKNLTVSVTQTVYNAYVPKWTKNVDGAVNSSPAANGKITYIGTDNGKVYAFDASTATGDAVAGFGASGVVNVGEAVKGQIVFGNGKVYVPGTNHVFILDGATGAILGVSPAIVNPVVAVQRVSDPLAAAFVGGADNKIRAINGTTGAALGVVSADLGSAVLNIEVGPSTGGITPDMLVVGCTAGDSTGKNGNIVMLKSSDLTPAFLDSGTFAPIVYVDANGPVKGRPVFSKLADTTDFFIVGSTSGLWSIDANTGSKHAWTSGGGGGANVGGNPYLTATAVDATPGIARTTSGEPRLVCAATNGSVYQIFGGTADPAGQRTSFGGWPVAITTPPGTGGIALGGGTTSQPGYVTGDITPSRYDYVGSDANDRRFFGLNASVAANSESTNYSAKGANTHIFDPNDTATFPGYTAGAFSSTPVVCNNTVVVGSSAARVYGFPTLQDVPPSVVTVSPANSAVNQATSTIVTLTYTNDVDQASATSDNVRLTADGAAVSATVAQGVDAKTLTITPDSPLASGKTYTVVASNLNDLSGSPVQAFSSVFTTSGTTAGIANVTATPSTLAVNQAKSLTVAVALTPGTSVSAVSADLTALGGSATQALTGSGNAWSVSVSVTPTSTGTKTIPVSAILSGGGTLTGSTSVNVITSISVDSATFSPSAVLPGASTTLTANVTPGSNPVASVTADLSAIGGASNAALTNGGSGNVYTIAYAVPAATAAGSKSVVVTATDSAGITAVKTATVVIVKKGDINADGVFDAKDVKEALKIAAGLTSATSASMTAGDLYKPGSKTPDGKITIEDALFLDRVLNGKDTLP